MKTLVLTFVSFCLSFAASGQVVDFISLEYNTVMRDENAIVKVFAFRAMDGSGSYKLKAESTSMRLKIDPESKKINGPVKPIDKEITISASQFQAMVAALNNIKPQDMLASPHPHLLDGASFVLSFGTHGVSVTYHANSPDYDTADRGFSDFLVAYKLILETAELDSKAIL